MGLLAVTLLLTAPPQAFAQDNSCNSTILDTILSAGPRFVGSTVEIRIRMRAEDSQGATTLTINQVTHTLDCVNDGVNPVVPCVDEIQPSLKAFDSIVSTTCQDAANAAVTWSTNTATNNLIIFTPSNPVELDTVANEQCDLIFKADILGLSGNGTDTTPNAIEESSAMSAVCNNTLDGSNANSLAVAVGECEVSLDKQVSCDEGDNWYDDIGDDDPSNTDANGCVANVGDTVDTRWLVSNTGTAAATCDITDNLFTVPGGEDAAIPLAGFSTSTSGECTEQAGQNTATLANCACLDGTGVSIPANVIEPTDSARIECCGVLIDKQLTCNQPFGGGAPTVADDGGLVSMNEDGTDDCDAEADSPVSFTEQIDNTGTIDLLDCAFADANSGGPICTIPGQEAGDGPTITPDVDLLPECLDQDCTEAFNNDEPNTATVTCTCDLFEGAQAGPTTVSAFDTAEANCIAAGVNITKTCEESATVAGEHNVTVSIENTGDVDLENCTIVDILHTDADGVDCAEVPPDADTTTDITGDIGCTSNGSILLATGGGPTEVCSGSITSPVNPACNTATVVCDVVGTEAQVEAGPVEDDCEVLPGGCFTRTPGYWAQHPESIDQVLNGNGGLGGTLPGSGGSIDVCGLSLTEAFSTPGDNDDPPFDFPQDLCSIGNDKNKIGTSPQQMQLIRQCAAAALNIDVSAQGELSCDGAFPGIAGVFDACCNELCPSGASPDTINENDQTINGVTMLSCIGALDAFNNADFEDDDFEDVGLINMSANPSECQEAHNDGDANDQNENNGRIYGPKK